MRTISAVWSLRGPSPQLWTFLQALRLACQIFAESADGDRGLLSAAWHMQKVFFNGWGSKEHLWQKQNWIFHIIPEDKAPQPDSPGISISCSASPTSLPVSRELQSYNMLCQGYIKNQNCSPVFRKSWMIPGRVRFPTWEREFLQSCIAAGRLGLSSQLMQEPWVSMQGRLDLSSSPQQQALLLVFSRRFSPIFVLLYFVWNTSRLWFELL